MGNENILRISRIAARLSVEIRAPRAQTAVANNLHHRLSQFIIVDRELVCVPAVLIVTAIGVDRTKHPVIHSHSQLMLKRVTRQRSMIHLDIHLEILLKAVRLKETDHRLGVSSAPSASARPGMFP